MAAASELATALAALSRCKGNTHGAYHMALAHWGEAAEVTAILRNAITTGSIGDDHAFADLIAAVPTQSIITAIDRVSPFRRAAPNVPVLVSLAPPTASWRHEAQPVAVTSGAFSTVRLGGDRSIAGILVYTVEAGRELGNTFVQQLGADVGAAVNYAESSALLDVANDGTGTAPAALTHNAITIPSRGTTADDLRNDLATLLSQFGGDLARSCWACSTTTATHLALHATALGNADVNVTGGYLGGLPLCCARGVPDSVLALIDASGVVVFDGGAQFSAAEQTTLSMPDGSTIDLWSANLAAMRFIRILDWEAGRPGCVAAITSIDWGRTT
ncbi:hypothetical protein OKW33_000817 [Paraburkholderia atlantica]|uniref:hypothetical protein n=1 Tax=Paraburkholderia atlantica TaxID=2654982 RepID=UPI003D237DEF